MEYYTTNEVAKLLGVCPETVRRWIRDGKLPCENGGVKGRTQRIAESDVLRLRTQDRQSPMTDLTKAAVINELLYMRDRINAVLNLLKGDGLT